MLLGLAVVSCVLVCVDLGVGFGFVLWVFACVVLIDLLLLCCWLRFIS